jgi:hypothetical protein
MPASRLHQGRQQEPPPRPRHPQDRRCLHQDAEIDGYSRLVPLSEIEKNDFNLNLPRYIDNREAEDIQDIEAHLHGGIPAADLDALADYWAVCPGLKKSLFRKNRPGCLNLAVDPAGLKDAVHGHPEFAAFVTGLETHFATWRKATAKSLRQLSAGCHPKEIIHQLSEDLLAHYLGQPLLDSYAVYQHLMDYWAETMQDDVYLIAADGWKTEPYRILVEDKKGKAKDKGWTCDLVPKHLIVARYFAKQQTAIDAAAYAKYSKLTEDDVKALVVDDEWLATLGTAIHGEIDRTEQALTGRVKELAERYATPLPAMTGRVAELETKVAAHLAKMGFN